MTEKTIKSWKRRAGAAREILSAFGFIGAADRATAEGLRAATGRKIGIVGNLKTATEVQGPSAVDVAKFREAVSERPIVLAASTHPGEDEVALDAFAEVRMRHLGALMIVVPRHPARGDSIVGLMRERGMTTQQWSKDKSPPGAEVDVLVADTIGDLLFWYATADGVYLGGATVDGIGGHNPVEPAQLGKRVFTGPYGFNFRETFEALEKAGGLRIGTTHQELADWWLGELDAAQPKPVLGSFFSGAQEPFEQTLDAVMAMLPKAHNDA